MNDTTTQDTLLQDQLTTCQTELADWKEKYTRVSADYQNFKRRTQKEQAEWMRVAQTSVFKDLLPIIDDLERAVTDLQHKEQTAEVASLLTATTMIAASLAKMLTKFGVVEIVDNKAFNPDLHEALVAIESADHKSGDIVAVLQKGYMLQDTVLRPAKVSVAK